MAHPARRYVADFDSTSSMLYALGRHFHGRSFPGAGVALAAPEFAAMLVNALPERLREALYRWSGWWEGIPPREIRRINAEEMSDWVVQQYPARSWPGAMIGSSNGAAVHLGAALGMPWLPQTYLVPVRRHLSPDAISEDLDWGRKPVQALLDANPALQVHQMHDPVQDRLMVERMAYFRIKRLRLGRKFEDFLASGLARGATILVLECTLKWPATRVADRHIFQAGGYGGATLTEYFKGGGRVERFLGRYKSSLQKWEPPESTGEEPEAEWGFVAELRNDIMKLAKERGYKVKRVLFEDPEVMSPFVADLYQWWYRKRGIRSSRLLVECFALLEPWLALTSASIPFWLAFNTEPSAQALSRYLDGRDAFDEIYMMLLSNGVDGIGLVPVEHWRSILGRARGQGAFLGVDERKFPRDFGSFVRYHTELEKRVPARSPPPAALTLEELDDFLSQSIGRYPIEWRDET